MIGSAQMYLEPNLYLFGRKDWSAFETSLRFILIEDARAAGVTVGQYITDMVTHNRYPSRLSTPYKVHVTLFSMYKEEVVQFYNTFKEKLKNDKTMTITNLYFMFTIHKIAKDYNVQLNQPIS